MEKPMIFLDEASYLFNNTDDALKEKVRKIEGVPNATYLVKDGMVFVFNKLIALIKNHPSFEFGKELNSDIVLSFVPEATVAPLEAIAEWDIVPNPYKVEKNDQSEWIIHHKPFNAIVPETFTTLPALQHALAKLLVGDAIEAHGGFVYREQPLSLTYQLDLAALPVRPLFPAEPAFSIDDGYWFTHLGSLDFEDGLTPLTKELFDTLKKEESDWQGKSPCAMKHAALFVDRLLQLINPIAFAALNDSSDTVPDGYGAEALSLRMLYPELSYLSDGSLFNWFDTYQMDCCAISGWEANRDNDFFFYLLGKLASASIKDESSTQTGKIVGFSLLFDGSLDESLALGRAWYAYEQALSLLAYRVSEAVRFLRKDKDASNLRGNSITTIQDMFRSSRKMNSNPLVVTQSFTNLS